MVLKIGSILKMNDDAPNVYKSGSEAVYQGRIVKDSMSLANKRFIVLNKIYDQGAGCDIYYGVEIFHGEQFAWEYPLDIPMICLYNSYVKPYFEVERIIPLVLTMDTNN